MMLNATEDFEVALAEIDIVMKYAVTNEKNLTKYGLFNKIAVVLLCTKFETFLENCLAEYVNRQLLNLKNSKIDEYVYEHLMDKVLIQLASNDKKKREIREMCIKKIRDLGDLDSCDLNNFDYEVKFSYGRHGQAEVIKLLEKFGFEELIAKLKSENFFEDFNSLNCIRNNIIHEDKTPTLTHQDVKKHFQQIKHFSIELDKSCAHRIMIHSPSNENE